MIFKSEKGSPNQPAWEALLKIITNFTADVSCLQTQAQHLYVNADPILKYFLS